VSEVAVERRPEERRYVLLEDGRDVGELTYRDRGGGVVAFIHTEVEPDERLRGLGSALVAGALDDARARGLHVVPICGFVGAFLARHPAYADLVADRPAPPA
jgi:predicted GNAT family acetyltransferase